VESKSATSSCSGNVAARYDGLGDVELVRLAQASDAGALVSLLKKYTEFVRAKVYSYFLVGAEREDLMQEGMIGLYKAVRDYRDDRETSFKTFAEMCITRQIITAIKTSTRLKHSPLNTYVSLNNPINESNDPERIYIDLFASTDAQDPAELVIGGEEAESLRVNFCNSLSDFEAQVLRLYVEGHSYQDIAGILDRHVKSIDNALQRIKRKVEHHLRYRECLASGFATAVPASNMHFERYKRV
jgi:RNA polymerase sporulation-specific sigma factor